MPITLVECLLSYLYHFIVSTGMFALTACQPPENYSCFITGTLVWTEDGARPIESLCKGDRVWSWDTTLSKAVLRRIKALIQGQSHQYYQIKAEEYTIKGVTENHPFYNPLRDEWIQAKALKKGDSILYWSADEQQARTLKIESKEKLVHTSPIDVYTLTIEGPEHNFFVEGVLVHNKSFHVPPDVVIVAPIEGEDLPIDVPIHFTGWVNDGNGYDPGGLTPLWSSNDASICVDSIVLDNLSVECEYSFTQPGAFEVALTVHNSYDQAGSDNINIVVLPNEPPNGEILSPSSDGYYYRDIPVVFEAVVSDQEEMFVTEAEDLEIVWYSDIDGEFLHAFSDSEGLTSESMYLSQGAHTITLVVTDGNHDSSETSVMVDVGAENSIPLCEIMTPVENTVSTSGSGVVFSGHAEDADIPAEMLTAIWNSNLDGILETQSANINGDFSFITTSLSVGEHQISLQVYDEVGAECLQSISVNVDTE